MNESFFSKIKVFTCGCGSAIVAFLLWFISRRKDVQDNRSTGAGIETVADGFQDIADGFREHSKRFDDANRHLEQLIELIEKQNTEN